MESAVRTGTVDFSTTILPLLATAAIWRAHSSQFLMLAARPAPMPEVLVGVLTLANWGGRVEGIRDSEMRCGEPSIKRAADPIRTSRI